MVFMRWFLWELILVRKRVKSMFEKSVKMCEFCSYIVAFNIIFSIKRDHESLFRFVIILFKCDFKCNFLV